MRFAVLGPLQVIDDAGEPIVISSRQQRTVLTQLALSPNEPVPVTDLADALWPDGGGPKERSAVRVLIHHLRRLLGPERIERSSEGYHLSAQRHEIDLTEFQDLVAAADDIRAEDPGEAVRTLRQALTLWRSASLSLADLGETGLIEESRLVEQRLAAYESLFDLELDAGRHREITAELRELAGQHPLRERLQRQLMLALAGDGRQAEALDVFERTRRTLAEGLGIDPSVELRAAHRRILSGEAAPPERDEPAATDTPTHRTDPAPDASRPWQLPGHVTELTGRAEPLRELAALTRREAGGRIALITGIAGVGKTALAVWWGQHHRRSFPDGAVFVDLRGYGQGEPLSPLHALHKVLTAFGVSRSQLPQDVDDASALFCSLSGSSRYLLILDNARSADQVRPLLPGCESCVVIVTSRDSLPGLVASHDPLLVRLSTLNAADSLTLLGRMVGQHRLDTDPAAAARLVELCGGLPLALRVVAASLGDAPGRPLAEQESILLDRGLSALDNRGDAAAGVRSVLWSTYSVQPTPTQRLFRLLSRLPYGDTPFAVAVAVDGRSADAVRADIDRLVGVHLLEPRENDTYGLHDLVRAYGNELSQVKDPPEEATAAAVRCLDWYQSRADATSSALYPPAMRLVRGALRGDAPDDAGADDRSAALEWLTHEHGNLVASVTFAVDESLDAAAWRLAVTMRGHLIATGAWYDLKVVSTVAMAAATRKGDTRAETLARLGYADALRRLGQHREAIREYELASRLAVAADWPESQAATLGNLGLVHLRLGHVREATLCYQKDLEICQRVGWSAAQAVAWGNLGRCAYNSGRFDQALMYYGRAAELAAATSTPAVEAVALLNAGTAHLENGDVERSASVLHKALELAIELGRTGDQITAHAELARAACRLDDHAQVRVHLDRAEDLLDGAGPQVDPSLVVEVLVAKAAAYTLEGNYMSARAALTRTVRVAADSGLTFSEADALVRLAATCADHGDMVNATGTATAALAIARRCGYRALAERAVALLPPTVDRARPRPVASGRPTVVA